MPAAMPARRTFRHSFIMRALIDSMCAVFEVTGGHLDRLDPGGAVRLVRNLVWADAEASGIPVNLINISSAIHDADGGIDGEVAGVPFDSKCGIIKAGNTRYQIKSGEFSPSESNIRRILFQEGTKNLKPRIKSCLDKNGTLVIVLTKWDGPDRSDDRVKNKFLGMLGEVNQKYKNAKIEIWRQSTIIGFLQNFPSIALEILGMDNAPILTHDDWSKLDDMKHQLQLGDGHKGYINDIREELRRKDQPIHIRVIGEPGIGKTRLMLESTGACDLAPLTVYAEDPEKLKGGNFLSRISRGDYNPSMVLVVDECDSVTRADLWNRLKGKSPGIKLVTIFNETDPSDGRTFYRSPPLGDEQIGRILGEYGVPEDQRPKWVGFCRPSPRAAHIIGQNLSENPDDILRSPDTVPVWDRYIASRIRLGSDEFKERKNVLLWLSLFKKFGHERSYAHEMEIIKNHIEKNHGIRPGDVNRIIKKLKEMKILQGGTPFYITPKILHVKLWTEWWETVGSTDMLDLTELATGTGAVRATQFLDLFERYCEMFEYAKESPRTGKVVEEYLGPGGPFEECDLLATGPGAELLVAFAKVDPKNVLGFLKRFLGTKGKDELIKFKRGRRQVVFALETASKRSDLFADSARLLLALGEAENESYSNNASGVFAGLFSLESGKLAPAETPSLRRLPVMREALESVSKERRLLAIRACNAALQASGHGAVMAEGYGDMNDFRPRTPASPGDIAEYHRDVLGMLASFLGELDADQRQEAASVILDNAGTLIAASGVSGVAMRVLRDLHAKHGVDNELVAAKVTEILDLGGDILPKDLAERLGALRDDTAGSDYHSLMRRYVGMAPGTGPASESLDDVRDAEIKGLAKRSLDAGLLRGELEWLPTSSAKNGSRFGYELGKADGGFRLLPVILDAQRSADGNASGFFLGGYFAALHERDLAEWESQLDSMSDDSALHRFVAEVTWRSGMTDRAGRRIISLIRRRPDLGFRDLDCFRYGRAARKLSESVFLEWIEFLKNENEYDSISLALNLFYHYFVHGSPKRLPGDLTLCLLFHQKLVKKPPGAYLDGILPHPWREICLQFVRQYPDRGAAVGEKILENFASGTLFDQHSSHVWDVLDEIAGKKPALARRMASYRLEAAHPGALFIKRWFRRRWRTAPESAGGVPAAMLDEMFGWVDEDPGKRAAQLAELVPLDYELARRVLTWYGGIEGVGEALASNFDGEGWTGPASVHYEGKKEKFVKLLNGEKDRRVRDWLNYYISILDDHLNRARDEEKI